MLSDCRLTPHLVPRMGFREIIGQPTCISQESMERRLLQLGSRYHLLHPQEAGLGCLSNMLRVGPHARWPISTAAILQFCTGKLVPPPCYISIAFFALLTFLFRGILPSET